MSMAARAISSRAVSSISLAAITPMPAATRGAWGRRGHDARLAGAPGESENRRSLLRRSRGRADCGGPGPASSARGPLLVAAQLELDGVHQRLPRRLDDVVGHAHRAPRLVAVARGDQHPGAGGGGLGLVEDAHLVVEQAPLSA